jgi:hypothetical protein
MKLIHLLLVLCFFFSISCSQKERPVQEVYNYLIKSYPLKDTLYFGEQMFLKNTKVEQIITPLLTSRCDLKIFKTELKQCFEGYEDLEILISIDSNNNFKIANSPVFDGSQDEFNSSFLDVVLEEDSLKKQFITEVALLYKNITYGGDIRNIIKNGNIWTAELWHMDLKWAIIKIEYYNDKVIKVKLENPKNKL